MWVLIFIMNVFLAGALFWNSFNDSMKDKLWVYVYLSDTSSSEQDAVNMKAALEAKWLKVAYTSKKDALGFVEKRVPDLTATLNKYKLENPLPATLYIRYSNQEDFKQMQKILERFREKILNMEEVSDNAVKTQENRVLNVINLSNFIQSFAYLVVWTLILTIIVFAVFFLKTIFSHFRGDIQAKKLLWATSSQIIQPFVNVIFRALIVAFLIAIILLGASLIPLDEYLSALLNIQVFEYISWISLDILAVWIIEIGTIMILLMWISYHYVRSLHKKLK